MSVTGIVVSASSRRAVCIRMLRARESGQVRPDVPLRGTGAGLGPASPAGTEPGRLGRARVRVEAHVAPGRGARRADRAAVDPSAGDSGVETPVKPRVAGEHRAVAGVEVERHTSIQPEATREYWRESDVNDWRESDLDGPGPPALCAPARPTRHPHRP